jgi:asparagine synthase (glutamine-hydrolysing)
MCGISGILSHDPPQLSRIREMTQLLSHRGPDDEGFLIAGPNRIQSLGGKDTAQGVYAAGLAEAWREPANGCCLALGHRRLSIIDLTTRGHQPMSRSGRYWMIYNGEVFNYVELREALAAEGESFNSQTDTEVVLAAYARWGKNCFSRFNGMWALAIYDTLTGELILSRDRFGVKPLYYWKSPHCFAFASEIKAFTALEGWSATLNQTTAGRFLGLGAQDTGSETMFRDVNQIKPGHLMVLQTSQLSDSPSKHVEQECWYNLPVRPFSGTFDQASREFRELFSDAVNLRLRSDVPLGFCLSGGLDSSAILCTASDLLRKASAKTNLKSFTSCSNIARYDERGYAEEAASAACATPTYLYPDEEGLFRDLDKLVWAQDEPFASTSIYAQWCVFKASGAAGLKVMLDGQGADESLCGYHNFRRPFFQGLIASNDWRAAWREARAMRGNRRKACSILLRAIADHLLPKSTRASQTRKRRESKAPSWLNRDFFRSALLNSSDDIVARGGTASQLSIKLLSGAHVQALLHWEDRNSMAQSIESRVPFLDYRLVEFIVGLPDSFKIRNGATKAVLRSGLSEVVPSSILNRKDKLGFVTPEAEWATNSGKKQFLQAMEDAVELASPIISPQVLDDFDDISNRRKAYNPTIWRAICFSRWIKCFEVKL